MLPFKPILNISFKNEVLYNLYNYFDNIAIKINDSLYYLPNIFCNHTAFTYTENRSSIIAVYINNKMLLIPGYCLMYVYNKFPVFNLQFDNLNDINKGVKIVGLTENVNVKITDTGGNLVFETTANGGQAIWNGLNKNGERDGAGDSLAFNCLCRERIRGV